MDPKKVARVALLVICSLILGIGLWAGGFLDWLFVLFGGESTPNPSLGLAPPQDARALGLLSIAEKYAGAPAWFIGVLMALASLLALISATFWFMGSTTTVTVNGAPTQKPDKMRGLGIAFGIFAGMIPTMIFMNALSVLAGAAFGWNNKEELAAFVIGGLLMIGVAVIVSAVVDGNPKIVYGLLFLAAVFTGAKYWHLEHNPYNLVGMPGVDTSQQHTGQKWAWWKLTARNFPVATNGDLKYFKVDEDGTITKESNGRLCPGVTIENDPTMPDGSVYYMPYNHGNAVHQLAYECASADENGVVTDACWNWMVVEYKARYDAEMPVDAICSVASVPAQAPSTSPTNTAGSDAEYEEAWYKPMGCGRRVFSKSSDMSNTVSIKEHLGRINNGTEFWIGVCEETTAVNTLEWDRFSLTDARRRQQWAPGNLYTYSAPGEEAGTLASHVSLSIVIPAPRQGERLSRPVTVVYGPKAKCTEQQLLDYCSAGSNGDFRSQTRRILNGEAPQGDFTRVGSDDGHRGGNAQGFIVRE